MFRLDSRLLRTLCTVAMCVVGSAPSALQAQARWYVSTIGADTLTLERVERAGSRISGLWVTYHNGADRHREIMRHEYTMALTSEGHPKSAHLLLRHPGGKVEYTYDAQFTDDTVFVAIVSDSAVRRAIAAHGAYPILGGSIGMFEAMIAGARTGRSAPDSTVIVTVPITGPFTAQSLPIALLTVNATRLGPRGGPTLYTDARGSVDSIAGANGQVPLRRVSAFDIDAVALSAHRSLDAPKRVPPP
ncbi:MAG TPA: hypothetical protein VN706_17890 [Gemmatimonadaceae bacterium]|nr:hypothetical protein [Gemmatimonadaceae bacterium]